MAGWDKFRGREISESPFGSIKKNLTKHEQNFQTVSQNASFAKFKKMSWVAQAVALPHSKHEVLLTPSYKLSL
jgi:hypothetical protein